MIELQTDIVLFLLVGSIILLLGTMAHQILFGHKRISQLDKKSGVPLLGEDVRLPPGWNTITVSARQDPPYYQRYGTSSSQHTVMRGKRR